MRAALVGGSLGPPRVVSVKRDFLGGRRVNGEGVARQRRICGASRDVKVISNFSPHETLGVSKDAGQKEIKRAFRKLALKHHPDREGGSEANFLLVIEAYEILTGKRAGKEGAKKDSWDYHDWFWKFAINRRKGGTSPGKKSGLVFNQSQMQSQLAGLRHRNAVRSVKRSQQSSSPGTCSTGSSNAIEEDNHPLSQDNQNMESGTPPMANSEDYVDSSDSPSDAGTTPASPETPGATAARAQEETRRRVSLNGKDAQESVRGQLLGLKRKSQLQQPSDEQDWAYL